MSITMTIKPADGFRALCDERKTGEKIEISMKLIYFSTHTGHTYTRTLIGIRGIYRYAHCVL